MLGTLIGFNANASLESVTDKKESQNIIFNIDSVDSPVVQLITKMPVFPEIKDSFLANARLRAEAIINLNTEGKIVKIELVQSTGNPSVDNYIIKSLSTAEFKPYLENGIPVPVLFKWPVKLMKSSYGKPWWKKILNL